MTRRLHVLLSAYQCGPDLGSVSQIGWEWYSRLAQRAAVTLVTHVRNRPVLEQQERPASDARIIYIDTEALAGPLYRAASRLFPRSQHAVFLISSLDFFAFDRKALAMLRQKQLQGECWDIMHCVTPVSPIASPTLHKLHTPVILGPWNGGLKSPSAFPEFMKQDSAWLYPVRNLGRLAEYLNQGIARSARILTATAATRDWLPKRHRSKFFPMLENGVNLDQFRATPWPAAPSGENPLQILFVGRLLPFKGVAMLLDALKKVSASTPVELFVVGEGPERVRLERQTAQLGLSQIVHFRGNQNLCQVAAAMSRAHVFCLPSVRESGGAVLLEAMASARPVIAIKYGGPGELVTEDVGCAIEPLGREHVVDELIAQFRSVVESPESWRRKGIAGRTKAEEHFGWDTKIGHTLLLYEAVLRDRQAAGAGASKFSRVSGAGADSVQTGMYR